MTLSAYRSGFQNEFDSTVQLANTRTIEYIELNWNDH